MSLFHGDLTGGGVDRSRKSQSFEQDLIDDFSSPAETETAAAPPPARESFLGGGVRSGGGSSRSMRTELQASSRRPSGLAAAAATAATLVEDAEARPLGLGQSQRRAGRRDDDGGGGHAEEEIEDEAEVYSRDGEALADDGDDGDVEAGGNDASVEAVRAAFLMPPRLRQQEQPRSPLSSPPPPPDASLAFAAVTGADSERVAALAGLPATGGRSVTVTAAPTSSPESVLQRMAEACRQAGVELVSQGS